MSTCCFLRSNNPKRRYDTLSVILQTIGWFVVVINVVGNKLVELCWNNGIPGRDSGVFATIAQGILMGKLPYRDFWDHKMPGIYYVDALIFRLSSSRPSSLHFAEIILAFFYLLLYYRLLRLFAGKTWSLLGTLFLALLVTEPNTNQGGNFTETYAVLPIILAYMLYSAFTLKNPRGWLLYFAGMMIGFGALLKPVEIAHLSTVVLIPITTVDLSGGLICQKEDWAILFRRIAKSLLLSMAGAASVIIPTLLYFVALGVGKEMWSQVFEYNYMYASVVPMKEGLSNLLQTLLDSKRLPFLWINAVFISVFAIVFHRLDTEKARSVTGMNYDSRYRVLFLLMVWFLLEFGLIAIGGRYYNHYFLLTIPPSVALLVWGLTYLWRSQSCFRTMRVSFLTALRLLLLMGLGAGFIAMQIVSLVRLGEVLPFVRLETTGRTAALCSYTDFPKCEGADYYTALEFANWQLNIALQPQVAQERIAAWIIRNTNSDAQIQVWGSESMLYFLTDRKPASRFIYNYPLVGRYGEKIAAEHIAMSMFASYIDELRESRPEVIVVTPEHASSLETNPALAGFIHEHYDFLYSDEGFLVYTWRTN